MLEPESRLGSDPPESAEAVFESAAPPSEEEEDEVDGPPPELD